MKSILLITGQGAGNQRTLLPTLKISFQRKKIFLKKQAYLIPVAVT